MWMVVLHEHGDSGERSIFPLCFLHLSHWTSDPSFIAFQFWIGAMLADYASQKVIVAAPWQNYVGQVYIWKTRSKNTSEHKLWIRPDSDSFYVEKSLLFGLQYDFFLGKHYSLWLKAQFSCPVLCN